MTVTDLRRDDLLGSDLTETNSDLTLRVTESTLTGSVLTGKMCGGRMLTGKTCTESL